MNKPLQLNKWDWVFTVAPDPTMMDQGWKMFTFGIYKFTKLPEKGEAVSRKDHKGIIIGITFWFPISRIVQF